MTRVHVGIVLASIWVILTGLRDVAVSATAIPSSSLAAIGFAVIAIGYNLLSLISRTRRTTLASAYRLDTLPALALINITTGLAWLPAFLAPKWIAPSTFAVIAVACIPIASLLLEKRRLREPRELTVVSLILIGAASVIIAEFLQQGSDSSLGMEAAGIGLALVVSVFAAANNVVSIRLNRAGVSADAVFASRFWISLLIALIWAATESQSLPTAAEDWAVAISVSLFGIGFATYALQHGLARARGAYVVGLVIASYPVFVLVIGLASLPRDVVAFHVLGACFVAIGIVVGLRRETRSDGDGTKRSGRILRPTAEQVGTRKLDAESAG